ncbi:MAG: hypothetical protein II844_03265 [Prevotella sp.]|nr:hypothetical protein [Prevotella sp.]
MHCYSHSLAQPPNPLAQGCSYSITTILSLCIYIPFFEGLPLRRMPLTVCQSESEE